jgi:hypothetical protein
VAIATVTGVGVANSSGWWQAAQFRDCDAWWWQI